MLSWAGGNSSLNTENSNYQGIDNFPLICSNIDHALVTFRSDAAKLFATDGAMWSEDNMVISAFISFIFLNLRQEQKFILNLIAYFDSELVYRLYGIKLSGRSRGSATELLIKLVHPFGFTNIDSDLAQKIYRKSLMQAHITPPVNNSISNPENDDTTNFQKLNEVQIAKKASKFRPNDIITSFEKYNTELDRLTSELLESKRVQSDHIQQLQDTIKYQKEKIEIFIQSAGISYILYIRKYLFILFKSCY